MYDTMMMVVRELPAYVRPRLYFVQVDLSFTAAAICDIRVGEPSKMVHAALLLLMLEAVHTDLVSPSA